MTIRKLLLTTSIAMIPVLGLAQGQGQGQTSIDWGLRDPQPVPGPAASMAPGKGGVDPASLLKPLADSWPTYSGDYTGRRYSALKQIDTTNVKGLTLSWVTRISAGSANAGGAAAGGGFAGR